MGISEEVEDPGADVIEPLGDAAVAMQGTSGPVGIQRITPLSESVVFSFDLVNLPDEETRSTVFEGIVAMCRDLVFRDGVEAP